MEKILDIILIISPIAGGFILGYLTCLIIEEHRKL